MAVLIAGLLLQSIAAMDTRGRRVAAPPLADTSESQLRGIPGVPLQQPTEPAGGVTVPPAIRGVWLRRARGLSGRLCFPLLGLVGRRVHPAPAAPADGEVHEDEGTVDTFTAIISWLISESVYLLCALLVAFFYIQNKEWFLGQQGLKPRERDFSKWTVPMIEPLLFWSCLCPGVRWADSMAMTEILPSYWKAFLLFFIVSLVSGISLGLPGWILMAFFMTFFRMRLRNKFEMEAAFCTDFLGYCCCCTPCMVAQEARHVEDAHMAGKLP